MTGYRTNERGYGRLLVVLGMVLLFAAPAFSQVEGTITGRAEDSSGALIPGVEVTISSPAMIGGSRTVVTDERGSYRFTLLAIGTYRVSFALPGFKTLNIDGVIVRGGATSTINGVLEVATVAETITVTSQEPTIDLEEATVAVNWASQKMDDLPFGRDLRGLAQMIPGMRVTTPDIGGTTMGGSTGTRAVTYGRSGGELVSIDGNQWGTVFGDFQSFEEITIETAAKGAESQNAGSRVNMVLKSGSNEFHGAAYGAWQDGSWQSNNVTQELLDKGFVPGNSNFTKYYDYNLDLGGKIIDNRLWFYAAYSRQHAAQFLSGFIWEETGEQAEFYTQLDNPTLKLTYQVTDDMKFDWMAQGNRKWQPLRSGSAFVPAEATQDQNAWTMNGPQMKWTYIISPRQTLDAGFARGGFWWPRLPNGTGIRRTDLNTRQTRGAFLHDYIFPIKWQYNATWSYFADIGGTNNEIKSGFLGTWYKSFREVIGYPNQQLYRYDSTDADAEAGMYFNTPHSVQVFDYPSFTNDLRYYSSWYLNDKITVNRNVTLNLGLRYDRYSSALPEQGNPGTGPFAEKKLFPEDHDFPVYDDWLPRVSLVYDVGGNGRTALKASYGRYLINGREARRVNPAANITKTYNDWDGSIPYVPVEDNLGRISGGSRNRSLDSSLRGSWLDEFTVGAELGLNRDSVFRFNIVRKQDSGGHKTLNLAQPFEAFTDVRYGVDVGRDNILGTSDDGVLEVWSVPRSYPTFGQVIQNTVQVDDDEGKDVYTAFEFTFNKQYSNGWAFLAGYTADYQKRTNNAPLDPNQLLYNWQIPVWNYTANVSGQYELPYGIMYSAVYHATSGLPYQRRTRMRNALGSNVRIVAEGQAGRYPWIKIWDNRVSKTFQMDDRNSIEVILDVFNSLNSSAIRSHVIDNGTNYLKPISPGGIDASAASAILTARIARIGVRWKF